MGQLILHLTTNLQGNARDNIDTMLVTNGNIHNEIVSVIDDKK